MLTIRSALPAPALRPYVKCFGQHTAHINGASLVTPLPARTEQFLMFFFHDLYQVARQGRYEATPQAVIVGPQTRPSALCIAGHIDAFAIHFQPTGFHHLFRARMTDLADRSLEARAVLDCSCTRLEEQLADARGFEDRIKIAEQFLLKKIPNYPVSDPVATAVRRITVSRGSSRIDDLVAGSGWSVRRFERKFLEQIGVAPKLYGRIVRLNQALGTKLASAERTWTEIAYELGYYDQMHMIHDFQKLAGDSPVPFLARLKPQRPPPITHSLSC
jgi:AraC-like DNA-binding protein